MCYEATMSLTSGIRAGSEEGSYTRRISLTGAENYGAWKAKLKTILNAEDCLQIVHGVETCPDEVLAIEDGVDGVMNQVAMNTNVADLRDFGKRSRKAASLIMQTVSDKISITIESLSDDPMAMWLKLKNDYEQVSPALKQLAKREFLAFEMADEEKCIDSKNRFENLVGNCVLQNLVISEEDQVLTLMDAIPEKYDPLKDTYYNNTPLPGIAWLWGRLTEKEIIERKREGKMHASALAAESFYMGGRVSQGGRGGRGGRGGIGGYKDFRASGGGKRGEEDRDESCFRCGKSDHWSRECPSKKSVCGWCGAKGHCESRCYDKGDGHPRGRKSDGGKEAECSFAEYGHTEVL